MALRVLDAVTIDILVEQPRAEFDLAWLFPKNTFEQFMEQRDWMVPRFFDPEQQKVLLSIHSYVIRTKHHNILFDTCCGNHKERGGVYPFHMVDTPYLENLAAMGCKPEDIDYRHVLAPARRSCRLEYAIAGRQMGSNLSQREVPRSAAMRPPIGNRWSRKRRKSLLASPPTRTAWRR